jgi:FAD/FMN-containing dehydrogenase
VRAILPGPSRAALAQTLSALAHAPRGCTAERLPAELWPEADRLIAARSMPDDEAQSRLVRAALLRRVKDTYDPMHLLNPGILGEAIA